MFLDGCLEGDGYVTVFKKCYYIEKKSMNYADATVNCQNHFGKLFEPRDSSTNDQVIETAKITHSSSTWYSGELNFYIGINDLATEGTFQYATGGDLNYTNWSNGEPNNSGNEDCVQTRWDHGTKWNDISCAEEHSSICEMI